MTLFAGINGPGKSTIVQALLLLRQAYVTGTLRENKLPLNGDLIKIGTAKDALYYGSQEDSVALLNAKLMAMLETPRCQMCQNDMVMTGEY